MAKIALLIGVSEFIHPGLEGLPKAAADVDAIKQVLQDPEIGDFDESNITILKNPERQRMEDEIYNLFLSNRERDDLLLFYFSGHGMTDETGRFYFSTTVTRKQDGKLVPTSAVSSSVVHEWMSRSPCKRQVIILDCCFSGAFAKSLTAKGVATANIKEQLGGEGRAILTAASATQYAWSKDGYDLSAYTHYLIDGIRTGEASQDGDDWLSMEELHDYVSRRVREARLEMTPEFYPVKEGYKIFLCKARITDPKLKYQKAVQPYANQGKIPPVTRTRLDLLHQKLGLSETEALEIQKVVFAPYYKKQENLQTYQKALTDALADEGSLGSDTLEELKSLQNDLELLDTDVESIKARLEIKRLAANNPQQPPGKETTKSNRKEQQQPNPTHAPETTPSPITRKRFLKLAGLGGVGLMTTVASYNIFHSSDKPPIQNITFEVVTVNSRGDITSHRPGQATFFTEDLGNNAVLEMVAIPGGKFIMGSPKSEPERIDSEGPQHEVTIQAFYMGKFPVTQAQWAAVASLPKVKIDLNSDPSEFTGANRPVEQVSWYDATEFCARLSRKTGKSYRLPSEAEWEYACRAGTTTPFHFGETVTTDLANYRGTDWTIEGKVYPGNYGLAPKGIDREQTTGVGSFSASAFGLYDMHGNVWEWCQDTWHDNYNQAPTDGSAWVNGNYNDNRYRLLRGGSWYDIPWYCRSAYRHRLAPDYRNSNVGFRVVVAPARNS